MNNKSNGTPIIMIFWFYIVNKLVSLEDVGKDDFLFDG